MPTGSPIQLSPSFIRRLANHAYPTYIGQRKLNTAMEYARAHDQMVEADYFAAMQRVEQQLKLAETPEKESQPVSADERGQILALAERLVEPELSLEARLAKRAVGTPAAFSRFRWSRLSLTHDYAFVKVRNRSVRSA